MGNIVHVLHSGSKDEVELIEYLQTCNALHGPRAVSLNYKKYQDHQTKDVLILNDALRCKKEKVPLIVLLSKQFFDLIWATTSKQGILKVISSYSNRKCVHIWLDIEEDYIRRRSKALLRNDGYFRTTTDLEIQSVRPIDVLSKLKGLLSPTTLLKSAVLNNHAIDNEENEMKKYFLVNNPNFKTSMSSTEVTKVQKKKSGNVYSDALKYVNVGNVDVQDGISREVHTGNVRRESGRIDESHGRFESNPQSNNHGAPKRQFSNSESKGDQSSGTTNNKNRNGKRKGDVSKINLLKEIKEKDKKQIAWYLDQGPGANWKQLAQAFSLGQYFIQELESSPYYDSQTKAVIVKLNTMKPELEMEEFVKKCNQIGRMDVATYISQNVIKDM